VNRTGATSGSSPQGLPGQAPGWPFRFGTRCRPGALDSRPLRVFLQHAERGDGNPAAGQDGGVPVGAARYNLSLRMHRIYAPRIVADHIMMQDDFVRLHKFLLDMGDISDVSEDVRKVIEDEWPELARKLPPKED
jgi:hypothetical protein